MSKRTLRVAAVVVGLCFVLTFTPMLNSAEKKQVSPSIKVLSLLKKPLFLLGSLLNLFPYPPELNSGIIGDGIYAVNGATTTTKVKPKTTDDNIVNPPTKKD